MRQARLPRVNADLSLTTARQPSRQFWEFLDGLSEDARTVAKLITEEPFELSLAIAERGKPTRTRVLSAVREVLRELGWSTGRISQSFEEIREALSN